MGGGGEVLKAFKREPSEDRAARTEWDGGAEAQEAKLAALNPRKRELLAVGSPTEV